ncbi:FtsX-like permease family protein [Ornithinimicrobium sp. W1679]|uniref:ABC transporter permease n=1 Tax=Ornithinimicrobium sp. W1679 TaxID=3418770 RepID=UPI003CF467DD
MSGRHRGTRRHTGAGMAWRQFAADPWVSVGLALLVAVVSLLLTAVPRALQDVNDRQLAQDVGGLSALQRDVTGRWSSTVEVPAPPGVDPWAPFEEGATRIRAAQPEPLRSMLQEAQMYARATTAVEHVPDVESGYYGADVAVHADPDLAEHVQIVDGTLPGPWGGPGVDASDDAGGGGGDVGADGGRRDVGADGGPGDGVPVVVLEEAAEELLWEVGDRVGPLVVAGTYRPLDPQDPRWQHVDNGVRMGVLFDPNRGQAALVTAFVDPGSRGYLGQPTAVRHELWFPVDPAAVSGTGVDVGLVRRQLTGMLAQQHTLVEAGDPALGPIEADQTPAFATGLTGTLDQVVRQQRATSSLLAVVAAGPLGVALAVVGLAARLVVQRRRPSVALVLARGAGPRQLRWIAVVEGLAVGVPAALLGHVLARALLPGGGRWQEWLVTAAVAAAPAVALAASVDDASLLQTRRDLSRRSSSRWRWVVEAAVVALAGLATWRLLDRSSRGDDPGTSGVDLLAAATPVLLALAACVVALRLYPVPLAALTRVLRDRRGLTPFLGAARALRDPAGGLVPTLAVVLGTTVALVSAVLLTTVTRGAEAAAWQANGAAVRVNGPVMTDALVEQLAGVEGVAAVARVADVGTTQELFVDGDRTPLRILVVDPALEQVVGPGSPAPGPSSRLYADGGPIPLVTGGDAPDRVGAATLRGVDGPVEVVGHLPELPGVRTPGSWALIDADRWTDLGRRMPTARAALVSTTQEADTGAVADAVQKLVGPGVVTTVQEELDSFTSAPVTTGLTRAFVGATVLTGLLTVLAVLVVQLMGTAARSQLLAVLRTLGLRPGQTRALTAWELGPVLATSLLVGAVLGLAVPWVLVRALDLTGLTGGRSQPPLAVDPLVVGAVLAAVVLTVLTAVTVSARLAGRTNLAQALRVGEDR